MRIWHKNIDAVQAFYANGLLRSLSLSMISIFVPIFVYSQCVKAGYGVGQALMMVAGYYILQRVVVCSTVFPISKIIERIGFRKSISISVIFLMGFVVSLILASNDLRWIWVGAICEGLNIPLYWISRDSALSQDIEGKSMGRNMSLIMVLENIASLTGPFVGGVLVMMFGFATLFGGVLIILLLSTIPLWWMPPHIHRNGVSFAGFWHFLTNGRYTHQAIAYFGCALNEYGNGVIWPIILFLQGINHEKLGGIYSLVALVTIVVQYTSGSVFDRLRAKGDYSDEGVYGFSTFWVSLSWVVRYFARGFVQILPLDMGRQLFGTLHSNFYADYLHLGGGRMGSIAYWVYLEVIYSLGVIFIFGLMIMGIYFGIWKELVLGSIALWSLSTIVIARESNL